MLDERYMFCNSQYELNPLIALVTWYFGSNYDSPSVENQTRSSWDFTMSEPFLSIWRPFSLYSLDCPLPPPPPPPLHNFCGAHVAPISVSNLLSIVALGNCSPHRVWLCWPCDVVYDISLAENDTGMIGRLEWQIAWLCMSGLYNALLRVHGFRGLSVDHQPSSWKVTR